ncbi:MAG: biosynthetic-type acetolactate synthase large subunit [bacterium]|nr:biosynthetic-type acetolactate synthase large subunit [bacterium]
MQMTGAQIFVRALQDLKVKHIFGYPGGVVLPLYDALYQQKKIDHILVRHEQGATHMADAYARVTGKPGVVLVTSGPGATNTVTGLANAMMDSVPMVCFTGQVPIHLIGNDAFQEADIVGITRPCTKHNYLVKEVGELEEIIHKAFHIATTGRPGPVLVDLPRNVVQASTAYRGVKKVNLRGYQPITLEEPKNVSKALELIYQSKKPLFYLGGGIVSANASDLAKEFAEKLGLPVGLTLMGLGGFPGQHPLSLGMLGMHGGYWANMAMHESDLLVALGPRFDDRVTGSLDKFSLNSKKIHLDVDATSVGKNVAVDVPLVGDAKYVLQKLVQLVNRNPAKAKAYRKSIQPWREQIDQWRRAHPIVYSQDLNKPLQPQFVIQKIYDVTEGKAIITTDVGQHQMWTAQIYRFDRARRWCTSGGLGTMGFGLPAAIGAQVAFPKETVFSISGDGGIQMNIQELGTLARYRLPVKNVIINNACLGMVRQWQEFFYDKRYSESIHDVEPDFVKLAESYGIAGFSTDKPSEVEPILKEALKIKGPVLMNFKVIKEENVLPMVPAGKGINEMMLA